MQESKSQKKEHLSRDSYSNFPGGSDGKPSAYNAGDPDWIPGSGRSSGEGNGNPLQYSCLENPMDGGTQQATVHGVAKSRTRLSDFTFTFTLSLTEEKSSTVCAKIAYAVVFNSIVKYISMHPITPVY